MTKTNRRQISYSFMIDQVPNEVEELMQTHNYRLVDQPFAGRYLIVSHPVRSLITLKYNDCKQLSRLMKNARKSPYFNAGMDRAKLT